MASIDQERLKQRVAQYALRFVQDHRIIGLGSGSTARQFARELGHLSNAAQFKCACTSQSTAAVAREVGLAIIPDFDIGQIEVTIDGADEVTFKKTMIKGGGGALMRERIAAACSDFHVTIVDDTKLHETLGSYPLPIEIAQYGSSLTIVRIDSVIQQLGYKPETSRLRKLADGTPFVTDNGNYIYDVKISSINEPEVLGPALKEVLGVLDHGLFIGLTDIICVAKQNGEIIEIR